MSETACILVVEDDAQLRETLVDLLQMLGYSVTSAANGRDALSRMKVSLPCLVLLDLTMPVMTGWELWDEMKADDTLRAIPVCVVSAQWRDAPTDVECALPKPVPQRQLVTAIEAHCHRCA